MTPAKWQDLVTTLPVNDVERELEKLGHWLEAYAALSGFLAYRTNRETMSDNLLRATAMTSACYVFSMPSATNKDKRERWHFELKWMQFGFRHDFVESTPELDGVLSKAQANPENPITPFVSLLFTLWPIVMHGAWVIPDLQNFLEVEDVVTDRGFKDPKNYLFYHGLRVTAAAASRMVTTATNISKLPGLLPARAIVSRWKQELTAKSKQKI